MFLVFRISLSMMSLEDCAGQMDSLDGELSNKVGGVWMRMLGLGG